MSELAVALQNGVHLGAAGVVPGAQGVLRGALDEARSHRPAHGVPGGGMYARPVGEAGQGAGALGGALEIDCLILIQHDDQRLTGHGGGGLESPVRQAVQKAVLRRPGHHLGRGDQALLAGHLVQGLGRVGVRHRLLRRGGGLGELR